MIVIYFVTTIKIGENGYSSSWKLTCLTADIDHNVCNMLLTNNILKLSPSEAVVDERLLTCLLSQAFPRVTPYREHYV